MYVGICQDVIQEKRLLLRTVDSEFQRDLLIRDRIERVVRDHEDTFRMYWGIEPTHHYKNKRLIICIPGLTFDGGTMFDPDSSIRWDLDLFRNTTGVGGVSAPRSR